MLVQWVCTVYTGPVVHIVYTALASHYCIHCLCIGILHTAPAGHVTYTDPVLHVMPYMHYSIDAILHAFFWWSIFQVTPCHCMFHALPQWSILCITPCNCVFHALSQLCIIPCISLSVPSTCISLSHALHSWCNSSCIVLGVHIAYNALLLHIACIVLTVQYGKPHPHRCSHTNASTLILLAMLYMCPAVVPQVHCPVPRCSCKPNSRQGISFTPLCCNDPRVMQ